MDSPERDTTCDSDSTYSRVISIWYHSEQTDKEKAVHGVSAPSTAVFQAKQFLRQTMKCSHL
jgi:hypothetical protein